MDALYLGTGSSLAVEGVKWGSTGPFAFNVWINQATNPGDKFQYIISTRARALGNVTDDNIFYPNQVNLLDIVTIVMLLLLTWFDALICKGYGG